MGYKKKRTLPSMTTLKVSLAPQSQVKTGVSDSMQLIPAFKYLGTIQLKQSYLY